MLLAFAIPAITYSMVGILLLTWPLKWPVRRWCMVTVLVACTGIFIALRVDSIGGNLAPVVAWRWTPTAEERTRELTIVQQNKLALLPDTVGSEDWPAFRGTRMDGIASGISFSTDWSTPPREVWRRPMGASWSSFIRVGDYLFTQEQFDQEEAVSCYQAENGEPVWQNRIQEKFNDAMGLGPRATPTYADGHVYALGGTGLLQCLDAASGAVRWKRDMKKDSSASGPNFGFSSSPLVAGQQVVVFSGGEEGKSISAYNCADGALIWQSGHRTTGYCSPHWTSLHSIPQLLMVSDFGIQSFAPDTGTVLWEHHWKIETNPRCIQPIVLEQDHVIFGATGNSGTRLLKITKQDDQWQAEEQWTSKEFRPYFNDGAYHKGHYYGFDGERICCLDVKTGKRIWRGERYSGQLLLLQDMDMLLILSEKGDVVLVSANSSQFNEVARFKALSGKTWNHPLISRGRLYVRNAEEAACFDLP
jgi:outer membrane protein assembly factor BamB